MINRMAITTIINPSPAINPEANEGEKTFHHIRFLALDQVNDDGSHPHGDGIEGRHHKGDAKGHWRGQPLLHRLDFS